MGLAAAQLAAGDRALVYTYYAELDGSGHRYGIVASDTWRGQLMYVDRLVQRLAEQLPPRSSLYVTADHGMVDVPFDERHRIDFDEDWELRAGVALLGGEGRARHVYAVPGAENDVLTVWREVLGGSSGWPRGTRRSRPAGSGRTWTTDVFRGSATWSPPRTTTSLIIASERNRRSPRWSATTAR